MWAFLGSTKPSAFAAKWDTVLGQYSTYEGLIKLATQSGWSPPTITLAASLASAPFATLFLLGGNFANVMAGEVKNIKRAIPIALVLSLILGIVFWSVTATLTLNGMGENWMYAVGYLWDNAPSAYSGVMPLRTDVSHDGLIDRLSEPVLSVPGALHDVGGFASCAVRLLLDSEQILFRMVI